MDILVSIIKFILANILLIIISSTLIGIIIRGIFQAGKSAKGYHKKEYNEITRKKGMYLSIISFTIFLITIFFLYKFFNLYVVIGFISWMIARIKDLIKEIETGIITNKRNMSNDAIDNFLNAISWIGLLIFNYGLYVYWFK